MPLNIRFIGLNIVCVFALMTGGLVAQDQKKQADPPAEKPAVSEKSESAATEATATDASTVSDDRVRPDFNTGKLRFEYKNTDWGKVIRGFAEEAKLDLNMPVTPEGTLTYSSNGQFTLLEAMDLINSFLMREQNFILIRHANMIFVHDLNVEIPSTMIETIPLSKLDDRGRFEMTQTEFDVQGIDADSFFDQIQPLVRDQGGKSMLLPLSNVLFVRETGEQLRLINRFLEMARTGKEEVLKLLPLEHAVPEEILTIASQLMPLDDENSYVDEEKGEKLKVIVLAFESKFILSGTANAVARFEKIVKLRDVEVKADATATADLAQPQVFRYRVANDLELNLQVVRAALAGTDGLRLQGAAEAGEIIAYGTEEHNVKILEVLKGLRTDANEFKVVKLFEYDADSMIEILNKLYGISDTAEEVDPDAPVFMADPLFSDQLIVKAKLVQIEAIQKFVDSLDPQPSASKYAKENFIRLNYKGREADRAIADIRDLIDVSKRPNVLDVRRSAAAEEGIRTIDREKDAATEQPAPQKQTPAIEPTEASPKQGSPDLRNKTAPKPSVTSYKQGWRQNRFLNVYAKVVQDEEKKNSEDSKNDDQAEESEQNSGEIESVPGAPIIIKETSTGLLVISDDLEMLAAIEQWLAETGVGETPELPTIVPLKFRKAVEMKDLLEMFLGLSSDSGGGGGSGLGGMLGGLAQNAIGGAAGQMLGGLMGGGGGAGATVSTSDMLTGDASIAADAQTNVLVIHANSSDLDLIMQYIDYFDVDGPEQDPFLDGRTYSIPVEYRDAAELSEIVKSLYADRIKAPKQQGGGNNQNAAQAQMLAQLMGRGRGGNQGGGSKAVEQEEPKMTIGVDVALNAVLVTGPEFLYKQVFEYVKSADLPIAQGKEIQVVVPLRKLSASAVEALVGSLNDSTPQKNGAQATANRTGGAGTPTAGSTGNPQLDAMRAAAMRAAQQGGQRGGIQNANPFGGRGGATGGRGGRGGGGRGGR